MIAFVWKLLSSTEGFCLRQSLASLANTNSFPISSLLSITSNSFKPFLSCIIVVTNSTAPLIANALLSHRCFYMLSPSIEEMATFWKTHCRKSEWIT